MITAVFLGCATVMLAVPSAGPGGADGKPAQQVPGKPEQRASGKPAQQAAGKPAPEAAAKASSPADQLLAKVQAYYDATRDFTAAFKQVYTRVALSKTSESSGTLMIKKPGMMRWEYEKPAKKLFVADGTKLYMYEPEEEQVVVDAAFKTAELSSSIRFLWGEGRLADAFDAKLGDPAKHNAPGSNVLELTPKKDATYQRLVLILDPKTNHVTESILYETTGNTNRFRFESPKINTNLSAKVFEFTPPPGVEVVYRQ